MSNTPPVRHEDLGRGGRGLPGYLYPTTVGLDYSPQLHGTEQPTGIGSFRQADGRGGGYRQDPGPSGRGDVRSRMPEDDGSYRMHNETVKTRDMNPGLLDADYKNRENASGFNMVFRNGDYDPLRGFNNCPPDSGLRNFNPKTKEQQQTIPEMGYSRIQQHQASLDPRLSNLQFLPASGMFSQQIPTPSFNRQYGYDMLPFLSYPLPREVPSYAMDRRTNLQQPYSQAVPSASFSSYADFTKSEMDRSTFPKYPSRYSSPLELTKTGNESDPHGASRRTPRRDAFSPFLNTYPRSASTLPDLGRKYHQPVGENFRSGSFSTNGLKQNGPPTVDLTLSTSPDAPPIEDQGNEPSLRERSSNAIPQPHRELPKENGSHHQGDMGKERDYPRNIVHKKHQPAPPPHYPTSSLSPFAGLLPFAPSALTSYSSMNSGPYSSFNSSSADSAKSRPLSKGMDHTVTKQGAPQWPVAPRYLTPSPHRYTSLETAKKNSSPSLQLKTKPTLVSDLTFNYPEGSSGSKSESKTQPTLKYLDNTVNTAKTQLWPKKDDSKLSPLENEIMDSARDGKPPNLSKYEGLAHAHPRMAPHVMQKHHLFNRSVRPPDYTIPKHFPSVSAIPPKNPPEAPRNSVSVIQSVPKSSQNDEHSGKPTDGGVDELIKPTTPIGNKPEQNPTDKKGLEKPGIAITAEVNTIGVDERKLVSPDRNPETSLKPGRKRKLSKTKDGEQRQKRKYTKRSDVWKKRGLQLQQRQQMLRQQENKKKEQTEQITLLSVPEQPKGPQQTEPAPDIKPQQTDPQQGPTKTERGQVEKISRPQRKSQGLEIEEYLYGWFSEEETENDDSSDEDYSCPAKVNKVRACRGLSNLRQTRRMPSRRSGDGIRTRGLSAESDEDYSVEGSIKKSSRRGRRRMEARKAKSAEIKMTYVEEDEGTDTKDATRENSELTDSVDNKKKVMPCLVEQEQDHTQELMEIKASTSDKIEVTIPSSEPESLDKIKTAEMKESMQPEVRKKRKYTRRIDKLSKPADLIPRKKRKYTKTAEKWFKNKMSSENSAKQNDKIPSQINKIPSAISPLLAELYTNGQHVKTQPEDNAKTTSTDPETLVHTSPRCRISSNQTTPTSAISPSRTSLIPAVVAENGGNAVLSTEEESMKVEIKASSSVAETSARPESQVPAKIPKKRGRKPGWRKHLQLPKDGAVSGTTTLALPPMKKKYKKPKGDGLSRFGMRKKCRRPKMKLSTLPGTIVSTPTRSHDNAKQQPGQVRQKRKYNVASRREKRRQYLISIGRIAEAKEIPSVSKPVTPLKKTDAHKISEELQSQEYDYDFKSLSFCNESENIEINKDSSSMQSTQEESSEQPSSSSLSQSRPQTPTDGMPLSQQSPFPSHLKKLCCNTAIGETQLHKAARIGYTENLQYYLETGTNVNSSDNAGYTALHEACMRNNMEAASLLLQYGADVNKYAVDGTRPLHDAIEYDHLEMVRLMLACGADPMLSKFSGRSIPNMIIKRSQRMKQFITAYLKELRDFKDSEKPDEDLEWKFPCSAIFEYAKPRQCSTLDYPPDQEELFVEFEMYDKPPCNTYLLQTDEESERSNYCLLDDYLGAVGKSKGKSSDTIRVLSMPVHMFRSQINENTIQRLQYAKNCSKPDLSCEFVEVVAVENSLNEPSEVEVVKVPILDNNDQSEQNCSGNYRKTDSTSQAENGIYDGQEQDKIVDREKLSPTLSEESGQTPLEIIPDPVKVESQEKISEGTMPEVRSNKGCTLDPDSQKLALEKNQDIPSCQKEISHRNGWTNTPDLNNTGTVDEVR